MPYDEPYLDSLHVVNLDSAKVAAVQYDKNVVTSLPTKAHIAGVHVCNCGDTPLPINETLSVSFEIGQSVTWSRTITDSLSVSANIAFDLLAGAGVNFSYQKSVAIAEGTQGNESHTCADSEGVAPSVPGNDELWLELTIIEHNLSVPITATIVVDGSVETNANNITRVSEILSEAERSFVVAGTINASTCSSQGEISKYERALTKDACKAPGEFKITPYVGSAAPAFCPKKEYTY